MIKMNGKTYIHVVKTGKSYHPWSKCEIAYIAKDQKDAFNWIDNNLKDDEHGYIQLIEKERLEKWKKAKKSSKKK